MHTINSCTNIPSLISHNSRELKQKDNLQIKLVCNISSDAKMRTNEAKVNVSPPPPYTLKTLSNDLSSYIPEKWDYLSKTEQAYHLKRKEFIEHCWLAYQKSYLSTGHIVIGRGNHLKWADLYNKVGNMSDDDYLTSGPERHGNVLKMDRWSVTLNDCWILGGVHRKATFRVVSKIEPKQLLHTNSKQLTVTAREMMGLSYLGYQYEEVGNYKLFKPGELPFQNQPNVSDYADYISEQERSPEASVNNLISTLESWNRKTV